MRPQSAEWNAWKNWTILHAHIKKITNVIRNSFEHKDYSLVGVYDKAWTLIRGRQMWLAGWLLIMSIQTRLTNMLTDWSRESDNSLPGHMTVDGDICLCCAFVYGMSCKKTQPMLLTTHYTHPINTHNISWHIDTSLWPSSLRVLKCTALEHHTST